MNIPEKAIICTPTHEDAVKLDQFLRAYTNRYVPLNVWDEYGTDTCWDLCEEDSDHRLVNMARASYEDAIEAYEDDEENERYIPDDPSWRFVSVDDFIVRCSVCDCPEDGEIEMGDLL